MNIRPDLLPLLFAVAAASFFCRVGGFWFMRLIRVTPRVEAALKSTPLAVMIGIVAPVAMRGNVPELAALASIAAIMRWIRNDLVAALVGVSVVAMFRFVGF
ncbi:MAG: branched-chain amino acid ABC transporter [Alphaproteobacteria bacterium]|nr:branched-chain amino acid ABC transporter [Alphaproteobacteria bacterium]